MQSRIREIRKAKGLTLQEVAERIGTTAQTVGRLETGMRTLSIKWVNRIAEALDCDAAELLAIPEGGDLSIVGQVRKDGGVQPTSQGTLRLRFPADDCFCLVASENMAELRKGDIIIFSRQRSRRRDRIIGRLAAVGNDEETMVVGRIISFDGKSIWLAPVNNAPPLDIAEPKEVAIAVMATRFLDDPV